MALRFLDSFDHYATPFSNTNAGGIWIDAGNASGNSAFGAGRTGNGWLATNSDQRIYHDMTDENVWILGFAFNTTSLFGQIAGWYDPVAGDWQTTLGMDSLGRLVLYRGFLATVLDTGTTSMAMSTYHHIEWKVEIGNAAAYEVRLNGVVEFADTGDTQNTANAFARRLYIGGWSGGGGNRFYDDLYILDDVDSGVVGAPNDDFLGDMRIDCLFPNGNGNSSQLDGSDGNSTDNYLLVDETPGYDGDTTYVESGDAGDKDTYTYTNLSTTTGTVYGVQPVPIARKTDAGSRTFCSVARLGTSEEDSADHTLTSAYQFYPDVRDGDPDGDQWTISSINSAEFGVKVTS